MPGPARVTFTLILLLAIAISGCCCCAGAGNGPTVAPAPSARTSFIPTEGVAPRGDRLLGIAAVPASDNDYGRAFTMAKEAGTGVAEIPVRWDEMEPSAGQYRDPNNDLANGNAFYTSQGIAVSVSLACIDTNVDRRPADLKGKPIDDPAVVDRYNRAVDYVLSKLKDVQLISFSVGNEVDVFLGNDDAKWQQYKNFYEKAREHIKTVKPGVKVGVKTTIGGANYNNVARIKGLNEHSDAIMVTYYPLEGDFSVKDPAVVQSDFDAICSNYPGKDVYFLEAGYPSSPLENSSEEKQAEFVRQLFAAWDRHADQVKVVIVLWLHDVSPSTVSDMTGYYGVHDPKFAAYLGTLGLRTYDGKDKLAWPALKNEAAIRGW